MQREILLKKQNVFFITILFAEVIVVYILPFSFYIIVMFKLKVNYQLIIGKAIKNGNFTSLTKKNYEA